jgi:hypothetical protein
MTNSVQIETDLINRHGPVMGGKDLMKALGFQKMPALRKAIRENRLGINVFEMPGHRGKFALTTDVAKFIDNCVRS